MSSHSQQSNNWERIQALRSAMAIHLKEQWPPSKPEIQLSRLPRLPIIRPPNIPTASGNTLPYQALPTPTSIRLIEMSLLDSVEDQFDLFSQFHCSVVTRDLEELPLYDALSYTWGDPSTLYFSPNDISSPEAWAVPSFDIMCDGKPISVGTNLYTALLAIRWILSSKKLNQDGTDRLPSRTNVGVWIDALCINQQDLHERSSQVMMMSRIYQQADFVYAWLGGGDALSPQAIQALDSLLKIKTRVEDMRAMNIKDESTYKQLGIPFVDELTWIGIYALLNRAWFKRAWIIQEITFAKTPLVVCGLGLFDFYFLLDSLVTLGESRWMEQIRKIAEPRIKTHRSERHMDGAPGTESLLDLSLFQPRPSNAINQNFPIVVMKARFSVGTEKGRFRASRMPLVAILSNHRLAEATDPRDKIYAFLGLSREYEGPASLGSPRISVDYTLSAASVYTQAAVFILQSSRSLNILSLRENRKGERSSDLPSWVPNFVEQGHPNIITFQADPWSASEGMALGEFQHLSNDELRVKGIKKGKVTSTESFSIGDSLMNWSQFREFLSGIPENSRVWAPEPRSLDPVEQLRTPAATVSSNKGMIESQSRFEVLWRTLLTNRFEEQYPAPAQCAVLFESLLEECVALREQLAAATCLCDIRELLGPSIPGGVSFNADFDQELSRASARLVVGRVYTAFRILLGHHHDSDSADIAYPQEFLDFENRLIRADSLGDQVRFGVVLDFITSLAQRKQSSRAVEVRNRISINGGPRTLFTTTEGHLGLGLKDTKAGDEVWILAGGDVPFILRSIGNGKHHLVGEAYVHGLMHGEAGLESSVGQTETIHLI